MKRSGKLILSFMPVLFLIFIGCDRSGQLKKDKLQDTLEKLKRETDFKPLSQDEVYAFLNDCYLPRLDSFLTKRKICIHPLKGVDFTSTYESQKEMIEARFSGDTNYKGKVILAPLELDSDTTYSWDVSRLINTRVITDTLLKRQDEEAHKIWLKEFNRGYMCISYPQYNANTNVLIIKQWYENHSKCGTGRESILRFKKIVQGWQAY